MSTGLKAGLTGEEGLPEQNGLECTRQWKTGTGVQGIVPEGGQGPDGEQLCLVSRGNRQHTACDRGPAEFMAKE